jgi:hypothetical protein
MLLPIVENTPSINYQEVYNASNVLLDQLVFRLSLFLNARGFASIPIPRDRYGNLEVSISSLRRPPTASPIAPSRSGCQQISERARAPRGQALAGGRCTARKSEG